jgi:hypothetical protein
MANENLPSLPYFPAAPKTRPEKILMVAMGAGVLVGAGFLVREYLISKKDAAFIYPPDAKKKVDLFPKKKQLNLPATPTTPGFPLKRGSTGLKVLQLQTGLSKLIGSDAMSQNGGIDGKFGSGTESALKMAGYPVVVDEASFAKITGEVIVSGGKSTLAGEIYKAASSANLQATLAALKKIGSVQEYTIADEQYKVLTKSKGMVRKTIVNDLLSFAFESNENAKDQIKEEFFRIGLKLDATSGKWSLSGLALPGSIITLVPTFVIDAGGRAVLVGRGVILGQAIQVKNGYTWFKSIDNTVAAAPSSDIKYL